MPTEKLIVDSAGFQVLVNQYMEWHRGDTVKSNWFSNKIFNGVSLYDFHRLTKLRQIENVDFINSEFWNCNFSNLNLKGCNLFIKNNSVIHNCVFDRCDIDLVGQTTNLNDNCFEKCKLRADITNSCGNTFRSVDLHGGLARSTNDHFTDMKISNAYFICMDAVIFSKVKYQNSSQKACLEMNNCTITDSSVECRSLDLLNTNVRKSTINIPSGTEIYGSWLTESSIKGSLQNCAIIKSRFNNCEFESSPLTAKSQFEVVVEGTVSIEGFEL